MSLKTRVEAYVGTISSDTVLADLLTASAKYVMDLPSASELTQFSTNQVVPTGGLGVSGVRILGVSKGGYRARPIDASMKSALSDYGSMYYATTTDPAWYLENGSVFVLPSGGVITVVAYPTVNGAQTFIYGLPQGLDEAVVLLTAIKYINYFNSSDIAQIGALSIDEIVKPTTPDLPSFTYTDATLGTYLTTLVGPVGDVPTYIKPTTDFSITVANGYINTSEDIELANAELGKQATILNKYTTDINNESNRFQSEQSVYQFGLQVAIQNAQMAQEKILRAATDTKDLNLQNALQQLNKQVQEYQSKLVRHQNDCQCYASEVARVIQSYNAKIQGLSAISATRFALMQSLERQFNIHLGKYRGEQNNG